MQLLYRSVGILFLILFAGCSSDSDDSNPPPVAETETVSIAQEPAAEDLAPKPAPHTNLLIIVLDAFRADMSSLYGYPKPTTPHLEEWAKRGIVFDRAYSQGTTTLVSAWSYFNGQYSL